MKHARLYIQHEEECITFNTIAYEGYTVCLNLVLGEH